MLAHYHGQTWNASELARSMDASEKSTRHYRALREFIEHAQSLPGIWRTTREAIAEHYLNQHGANPAAT